MPLFHYRCESCNQKFEVLRPVSERNSDVMCPKCKVQCIRVLTNASVPQGESTAQSPLPEKDSSEPRQGKTVLENISISGGDVGISIPKGMPIDIKGLKTEKVKTPIQIREQ